MLSGARIPLALLFGSLMGTRRPPKYLNKAIKAGMKKGKPDINLPVTMGGYRRLWIELKKKGGEKPREDAGKDTEPDNRVKIQWRSPSNYAYLAPDRTCCSGREPSENQKNYRSLSKKQVLIINILT
jgi:hypothetical protein